MSRRIPSIRSHASLAASGNQFRKSAPIVPDNGMISLTDTDGEEVKKSAKESPPPQFKCDADGTIIIDSDTDEEHGADVMLPSTAISSPVCVLKQRGRNEIPKSTALLQHEDPVLNDQAEDVLMSVSDGPHELRSLPVEISTLNCFEETFSPPPPNPEHSSSRIRCKLGICVLTEVMRYPNKLKADTTVFLLPTGKMSLPYQVNAAI
ncbi:uncharacterized protein LAESUDRAFT_765265 [Laetiporus sulphureus 93-53]|uniref:Uncharacterized protein n=1 Tax=Laetiporus sulphureus 93-53 TaxID=1314785 RepID=A0A165AUS6_9APHY|nr:uncharacterized protein LAESUDRAFT_765265 [Laetiporus sulphureus 93-53]KZS99702.1 hypothetical protein LAESUDRAFT_765265 [Laetiporus sulphureus 93-53]